MADDTPFFIIGAGRSGTTLLRLILAGHSRLHIPPETWFILPLIEALPLSGPLDAAQVERAVSLMVQDYRWPDMEIAAEDLRRQAEALDAPRLVDVINLVYRHHLAASGKPRFGDKTRRYINIVPQLLTLYPGAEFIHLIRDGRDVAASNIELNWNSYYDRQRFSWTLAMEKRREFQRAPFADRILDVRYEDLVSDLEATVRRFCAFLGEQFEPGMLDWQQLGNLVPERERHIHGKLAQPVSGDAVAAWRRKLNAAECFAMEACLHKDLRELGYPLRYSGGLWPPILAVSGTALCGAAPLLRSGTRYLKRRNLLAKTAYI